MKWLKRVVVALLVLAGGLAATGYFLGARRLSRRYDPRVPTLGIDSSPRSVARGEHLARTTASCAECHGDDFGGGIIADNGGLRVIAPNLTRGAGGAVSGYRDQDWVRAILGGVARDGRPLLVMPSDDLRSLADEDVAAVVAYMKTVPPVDRSLPPSRATAMGKIVLGLVRPPILAAEVIDARAPRPRPVATGPNVEYGRYLIQMCAGCHGPKLEGGLKQGPGAPPAADISPASMAKWEYEQFVRLVREGKRRDGTDVNPIMPWRSLRHLTDEEVKAMWLALRGS
jgi:mono/diheme cytochrome c family protein